MLDDLRPCVGAEIVDGKSLAMSIQREVAEGVTEFTSRGFKPHLAVVIAGDDQASHVYVRNKERACQKCGIMSTKIEMPTTANLDEIIEVVESLNSDPSVHGILVQSPAPDGVDELQVASSILPQKDVDGFHPINLGRLVQGYSDGLLPCTPSGVMSILESTGFELEGSRAVVLGRSRIVGMPMSLMLAQKGSDATVTIVHSRTSEIESICREADILVAAVGSAHMVGPGWVKPGAFVVDVGISRTEGGLAGDVSPDVSEVAGWLTPVPGGVGPMTIAMLMKNTLAAAEMQVS